MDSKQSEIISVQNPHSPIAEAYKSLRTNIKFSSVDKDLKTIAVTSTDKGEGKSTVSSNLAAAMALDNSRVLLIDCDLRRPTIHKKFTLSNLNGLSSVLTQQNSINEVIQKTDIEGVDVLTSGPKPPNPSEMLGSKSMKQLLNDVSKNYDRVIVDAPPIGIITDAGILSTYTDGSILVVASKEVDIEMAQISKARLDKVGANILGVVLNKFEDTNGSYGYYNYYYGA